VLQFSAKALAACSGMVLQRRGVGTISPGFMVSNSNFTDTASGMSKALVVAISSDTRDEHLLGRDARFAAAR